MSRFKIVAAVAVAVGAVAGSLLIAMPAYAQSTHVGG